VPKTPFSGIAIVDTESRVLSRSCDPVAMTVSGDTMMPVR
jgi:hypothetical protein